MFPRATIAELAHYRAPVSGIGRLNPCSHGYLIGEVEVIAVSHGDMIIPVEVQSVVDLACYPGWVALQGSSISIST